MAAKHFRKLAIILSLVALLTGIRVRCGESTTKQARDILWAGECGSVPLLDREYIDKHMNSTFPLLRVPPETRDNLNEYIQSLDKLMSPANFSLITMPSYVTVVRRIPGSTRRLLCSGILLNNRQVLAPASCIRSGGHQEKNRKASHIFAFAGGLACERAAHRNLAIDIMSVCASRRFFAPSNIVTHDIAVLQLRWFLPDHADTSRACLPKGGDEKMSATDGNLYLIKPRNDDALTIDLPSFMQCQVSFYRVKVVACPGMYQHKTTFCVALRDSSAQPDGSDLGKCLASLSIVETRRNRQTNSPSQVQNMSVSKAHR